MQPCNQCGKCCLIYGDGGLAATPQDLEHWATHRPDVYRFARGSNIWVSPETGQQLTRCPWLQGDRAPYSCSIYDDRPEDCRSYPVLAADMVRDGCEMIEVRDLQ